MLKVRNWEKWQTYRKDRGTPPWIKVYARLLTDPDFAELEDHEKWHVIGIWLIARERNGLISDDPKIVQRLINSSTKPDLEKLLGLQVLERPKKKRQPKDNQVTTICQPDDNQMTSSWQPNDAPETDTDKTPPTPPQGGDRILLNLPCKDGEFAVLQSMVDEWRRTHPRIDIDAEIRKARQWCLDNPTKRKTLRGGRAFIGNWLKNAQPSSGHALPMWSEVQ